MVNPTVSEISPSPGPDAYAFPDLGGLVLARPLSAEASVYDWIWYAWDEAELEAERAYEAWCLDGTTDSYVVYRAAQDRADAGQDALAQCAAATATRPSLSRGSRYANVNER
jgi:hypothetical protein